jgi:hypothetical protein
MRQMTPGAARVVDPILSEVARGFRSNASPVASLLFPVVPVAQRGGRIISFGPDDFRLVSTARAPGAGTKRVQFGHAAGNFSLVDYSLEGAVPIELAQEAEAVPGIDLQAAAVRKVRNMQELERENQAAQLARNAANYGAANKTALTGTDQFSHASSDPFTVIETGKEAIRSQVGQRPNVLVLAPKVLNRLRVHGKILDRLSTAKDRPPATVAQLAALFEVEQVVEAGAITHDGTSFSDVWGRDALLAYATPASLAEMGSPNFGYTYQLDGMPLVEEGYFERNSKTWYYPVTDARQVVLAGSTAGYLIQDAVAS